VGQPTAAELAGASDERPPGAGGRHRLAKAPHWLAGAGRGLAVTGRGLAAAGRWLARAVLAAPPVVQGLLALAVYLAIWVFTEAYPLLHDASVPQLAQGGYDPNFYVWALHWWPYAVGHGLNPLFSDRIGAPAGYDLAWVTTVAPLALLMTPVTLTAGPIVSFNLLVAVAVPLSGWGAFVACRRLTGKFWASLAAGAAFGFSAFEINHSYTGQLNLSYSVLLPLAAYLMVAWWDGGLGPRAFTAWTALVLTVQAYLFLETFADLTAVLIVGFAAGAALAGRAARPRVARLALLTGIAYLISLVLTSPLVGYALAHQPPGFTRQTVTTSIALNGLVVPLPGHGLGLGWLAAEAGRLLGTPGRDGYLGVPLLLLGLVLPLIARASRLARLLLLMTILVIAGALGPVLRLDNDNTVFTLPWSRLWSLPVATSAYPSRLMVFAALALSVAMALWLAQPGRWLGPVSWARWLLAGLALAALGGNIAPLNFEDKTGLPAFITTGAYRSYIPPDGLVVVISGRGNTGMLWSAATDSYFRLAGGFINAALSVDGDLPAPVAGLMSPPDTPPRNVPQFQAFLRDNQVTDILVEQGEGHEGRWPSLLKQAGLAGRADGGVLVYPVNAVPRLPS
jgi:hypothetical protein